MTCNLRTLGLALAAGLAMSAVGAPMASAESFFFKSASEHTTLKGEQEGTSKMTVDGGTVLCSAAQFNGTMAEEIVGGVKLTASYEKCTAMEGLATATVNMNGCAYVLEPITKSGSNYEVEGLIDCDENKTITVTVESLGVTKCTVHIGAQEELETVTVKQEGSPSRIQASIALTGIEYSQTAGSGLGACASASGTTNGTYETTASVKGYSGESQVNLSLFVSFGSIKMTPGKASLPNLKSVATFTVENVGEEELIKLTFSKPTGFVVGGGTCGSALLPGKSCTQKVECFAKGSSIAEFTVRAEPTAVASSSLRDC